jgi:hypothetical protein
MFYKTLFPENKVTLKDSEKDDDALASLRKIFLTIAANAFPGNHAGLKWSSYENMAINEDNKIYDLSK